MVRLSTRIHGFAEEDKLDKIIETVKSALSYLQGCHIQFEVHEKHYLHELYQFF